MATPPARGLGVDIALIRRIVGDDPEALNLLDQALQNPHGGDRKSGLVAIKFDNIKDEVTEAPTGTSITQALRRLRKDRPDLHARVLAQELSSHRVMIEAGFREPTVSVLRSNWT